MPPIATIDVAIRFQIVQKLQPILLMIFIQRSSPGPFNTEPDPIAIHHSARARERQTVITKCLPMMRSNHIDRVGAHRYDFISNIAAFIFTNRWEAVETPPPEISSFPRTRGFDY